MLVLSRRMGPVESGPETWNRGKNQSSNPINPLIPLSVVVTCGTVGGLARGRRVG